MMEQIQKRFAEAQQFLAEALAQDGPALDEAAGMLIEALQAGRGVLIFGNGGSASDAQHIAGELVGRFFLDRQAIRAVALTTDTSILTAVANDLGFETIFARQIEALGAAGDVAWALSTSGNSPNVVQGLTQARKMGLKTFAMTGQGGGRCAELADVVFRAPARLSPRIQEVHMVAYHVLCELVEASLAAG